MQSLYNFIIKPVSERYLNKVTLNNKDLIVNTKIEDHSFVSKKAVIVKTPAAFKTPINVGDYVYVHHNIFRRYYDLKVEKKIVVVFLKTICFFAIWIKYICIMVFAI